MNDKLIIEKVKQLKETAINNQSNWQFPNEHYIEATGMIIALNEVLSVLESSTDGREKDKICNDKCKWFKIGYGHCNFCIRQVKEHDCKDNFESSEPEKPKDKVMAEEIYNDQAEFNKWLRENTDYEKEHIISMMEEYAQQFKSNEVTDEGLRVTDEEIENWAANFCNKYDSSEYGYGDMLIEGAKAMRDGKI